MKAEKLSKLHETMKSLRFGVEIESVGLGRERLARTIQTVVGGEVRYEGGGYDDKWICVAPDGRKWTAMRDGSLSAYDSGEITTPILTYADLDNLQAIVRAVRAAGARVDSSCGIHVHVDGARFVAEPRAIRALVQLCANREPMIEAMLGLRNTRRQAQYCQGVQPRIAEGIRRCNSLRAIQRLWYGGEVSDYTTRDHYHGSRYYGVNLHSLFFRGTIEFRWFNGSLHADEVKAYVHLVLAFAARALTTNQIWGKKTYDASTVLGFASGMLRRLGLVGDEFKNSCKHLTKNLRQQVRAARPARPRAARAVTTAQAPEAAPLHNHLYNTVCTRECPVYGTARALTAGHRPTGTAAAAAAMEATALDVARDALPDHDHDTYSSNCHNECPRVVWRRIINDRNVARGGNAMYSEHDLWPSGHPRSEAQTDEQAARVLSREEAQIAHLDRQVANG